MTTEAIIQFLKQHKGYLRRALGVRNIGIFGSYARGTAAPGSDIDILVEQEIPSYRQFVALRHYLEENLGTEVDLVRRGPHLRATFLQSIERDLVYV